MFCYLIDERGLWLIVFFFNDVIFYWKLDKMEDFVRWRLKFRRNYYFNKEYLYFVISIFKGFLVDFVNEWGSFVEFFMGGVR